MTITDHAPRDTDTFTDEDALDTAVLEVVTRLCGSRNRPVRWAVIRNRLPGHHSPHGESLVRLWTDRRLNAVKVDGRTYVNLPDELDLRLAAADRANGTPRRLIVLDRTA